MSIQTAKHKDYSTVAKYWQFKPTREQKVVEQFSADDVINAYFMGKEASKNEEQKILSEKFRQNLKQAQVKGSELFKKLSQQKIKIKELLLNPRAITDFSILFVVDKNDFLSEKINRAYKISIQEKQELNKDTFQVEFTFMPYTPSLNRDKLISDGFILEYVKK